ncbi:alpha/beta fold hydrolase [Marinomonas algicola]|uniref:alpha/beta fold hydrolase n=1 Tax=Marinomonas algicola TaxID=2773454 RepID=UPI00174D2908|nr:alpha/beta hydrolase [Marinomonas algicola]
MKIWFIIILCLALSACSSQKSEIDKNAEIAKRVAQTPNLILQHTIKAEHYQLHYVSNGNATKPNILFIHGTPGSWSSFARYFEDPDLMRDYNINALDRPGWGKSSYPTNHFPKSLSEQSVLIGPLLKDIWEKNNTKTLIIGHSLGGSLAPKLAVDYPEYIEGVLILAGDVGPKLAEARWFNFALDILPEQWVPKFWYNANQEVLELMPELEKLQNQYSKLDIPVTFLQGTNDDLVRPQNAEFAQSLFPRINVVWLDGASHIINLTHEKEVKKAIQTFYQ